MSFSDQPVVVAKNLEVRQGISGVLEHVNFEIQKGEFVYLIGRTGSGKSSLLKTLYADLKPFEGEAAVAGFQLPLKSKSHVPKLRRKLGIIFQDFQLLSDRSVNENLDFVLRATGWRDPSKRKARIEEVLRLVGLSLVGTKMPHQLSGGEQQRVVIARAILNEPMILLADEPTGNLDPEVAQEILQLFFKINRSGTAVLMATHNHQFIKDFPARVLRCKDRQVIDEGVLRS
jgi:cell division transport system ATP-binding protein